MDKVTFARFQHGSRRPRFNNESQHRCLRCGRLRATRLSSRLADVRLYELLLRTPAARGLGAGIVQRLEVRTIQTFCDRAECPPPCREGEPTPEAKCCTMPCISSMCVQASFRNEGNSAGPPDVEWERPKCLERGSFEKSLRNGRGRLGFERKVVLCLANLTLFEEAAEGLDRFGPLSITTLQTWSPLRNRAPNSGRKLRTILAPHTSRIYRAVLRSATNKGQNSSF